MIHYHGTPITPRSVLNELAGKHFCVSFATPQDVEFCHVIGQSVMLDNGAYSIWRKNQLRELGNIWESYYSWARHYLQAHTTWAIAPDVIGGTEAENDQLLNESIRAFGGIRQMAAVWHVNESFERLEMLVCRFDKVAFGSAGEFSVVGSPAWNNRINEAFNRICRGSGRPPCWIHMLRGMSLAGSIYPFASVDSTDVARNHNRKDNAKEMAEAWDAQQCPPTWAAQPIQAEMAAF